MFFVTDPRLGYSGMCEDPSVCRDYLRNVCKRGKKCKYKHPSSEECERLRRFDKTFCHDFQNSTCRRLNCKFLHYTKEEEEVFRRTGYLPNDVQWSHLSASNIYDEKTPICKDFANGACNRGANCKYRHITTTQQQAQEVANPTVYNQSNLQEASYVSENTPAASAHIDPSLFSNSTHFSQPSLINNAVIVSPADSVLNPVSNAYIPGVSSHSLMGLISNTSTGQPTLYAHSSLVSITSAPHISPCSSVITVGASPTQHPNVIHPQTALSAPHATYHIVPHDASSHHHHHHLLATSSSHSQAPTLLTIPLSQFTCNVSNNSLIQSQAAIACSTQHHAVVTGVLPAHPSISSASATYYPSYGVFHINQPPSVENCDQQQVVTAAEMQKQIHETKSSRCPTSAATETVRVTPVSATTTKTATTSVTSVSSSTTAVLAAAAAAGYIAQHLPVIGSNNLSSGSNISQEHTNYNNNSSKNGNPSKGVSVHESAIAAAANLPTVSAAAAAAVAAAAAFACSTSMSQNSKYHAMLPSTQTKFNDLDMESSSAIPSPRIITSNNNNNSNSNNNNITLMSNTESCSCQNSPHKPDIHSINNNNNNSNNDYNTNMTACFQNYPHCSGRESSYSHDNNPNSGSNNSNNNSTSVDSLSNPMPSSSEYLNPADEEQAKTAAAVAAAACIGAIFSQPMAAAAAVAASSGAAGGGVGNSTSSSVAAMLGNLIGCNEKDIMHAVQSSSATLSPLSSSLSSSSYGGGASLSQSNSSRHNCSISIKCDHDATVINRCPQQQQQQKISTVDEKSSNDDHQNEHGGGGGVVGNNSNNNNNTNNNNSLDQNNVQSTNTVNASSSSSDRCKCTNTLLDNNSHSLQDTITSDSNSWSSVTTTMASAAKAAAAAAVAATAAVTGSANFFRLTQLKNKVDPQLQSGSGSSSLSSSSSLIPASTSSRQYNSSLRCIDQSRNLRLSTSTTTDQMSSSVMVHDEDEDETGLSGCLSTKEAVTMTSAAAAAAMVAAAATVAAEQHQLIGNSFLSEISHSNRSEKQDVRRTNPGNSRLLNTECDYHRACSSSSSHNDFASPSSYEIDSQMYSLTCQSNRYSSTKRHKNKRRPTVDCHYPDDDYSSLHHHHHHRHHRQHRHHTSLPRSVDDDYEDDDGDTYEEDDDVESTALMSPSPEVTPPYNLPSKISKRDSLLGLSYSRGVEDSRPASCETSPDPWRPTNRKIVISRTTGSKTDRFEGSSSHAVQSINTPHYANNETTNTTTTTTTTTTNPRDDLLNNNSTLSSSHVNPIRRSLSTSALPSKASFEPKVLKVRSKSYPALNRFLHSGYQKDYKSSVFLTISNCNHRYLSTDNYFPVGSIVSGGSTFVKRKLRRSTHRYASRLSNSNDTNSNTNTITTTSTAANRSFLHTNTRRPLTNVSPTSVLSEEGYSGRDEGDDPDFVDPDYDDEEELYVFSVPQTSLKRSSSHSISKYSTKRKRSVYSSTSSVHLASASIKQQYALRAENARLRRKLLDLMRQRGDLRAANEMLLEQNARLRQSSKRVSAVARMAESATKFIEAHKKSQLAQSNSSFSSAASAAQSTVPFSIAQAAAAAAVVAAAAQSETNPPNVTGVYVSSPTASIHHQHNSPTINAQGGGAGGGSSSMHPLFSQIASGNTISTGIAIPSNHALTAVQIQAPIAPPPPAPPPPHATALIHHPQGLHPQQQTGISNYYQHQMNRPIDTLTASIANASVSPGMQNLSQPSSAFQVCHYPVVSIANVFPKLSQDVTSESAKLVPVGVPNTVTLLLGQSTTPQTSTYAIPASVSSHPSVVPMQIPVSVGTHLTPAVSCPSHHTSGGPAKLVVSVAYPNQAVAAAAAAAASVMPTTSTQYISPNPVNNRQTDRRL